MNDFADAIKSSVTVKEVFDVYGIEHSRGKAICPFHTEKTPSLIIHRNNRAWKCYGCGEGGTVIDFVMKYDGINFQQAIIKLNDIFSLNLPISRKMTVRERAEQRQEITRRREQRAAEERKRLETELNYLDALIRLEAAETVLKQHPKSFDEMSAEFIKALSEIDSLRYDFMICDMKRGETIGRRNLDTGLDERGLSIQHKAV